MFKMAILALTVSAIPLAEQAQAQTLSFNGLTPLNAGSGPNFGQMPTTVNPTSDRLTVVSVPSTQGYGLTLSSFASEQDLAATQAQLNTTQSQVGAALASQAQLSAINAQLNSTLGQLNTLASQINGQIARDHRRSSEGISLASAMTVLPPVQGDRFSLTIAGAGFDGQGGGSVTGTYRVADRVLLFGGYARGPTQNLVKAGISFSFN